MTTKTGIYNPVEIVIDHGFDAPLLILDPSGKPIANAKVHSNFVNTFYVGDHRGKSNAKGMFTIAQRYHSGAGNG